MTESASLTHRYFASDAALFIGPLPPAAVHSHHAIQGCVALEDRLTVEVAAQGTISTAGALIGADVPHAVSAPGRVAHFYALPGSPAGARLVGRLAGRPLLDLEGDSLRGARSAVLEAMADDRAFPRCLDALIGLALDGAPPTRPEDPRTSGLLDSLRSRAADDASLAVLAREVGLSSERFRHLVREQVGIPLRQVRRWARLLDAIEALQETGSVTEAAHAAGFADAAHLSRVFREAFSFPPSAFLRDSRFVQARGGDRA